MSGTRRAKPRREESSSNSDEEEDPKPPTQSHDLFTVSAETPAMACTSPVSKNPRWLANHEKEARSEAIREKIHNLIRDIEAEETETKPAMKKAWLHAKKMELRRISFKQPEGIIAEEASFRRARRKLREARRRRKRHSGGDGEDNGGDSASSEDGASRDSVQDEAGAQDVVDVTGRKGHRRWTVSGAAAASADRKSSGNEADGESNKEGESVVFNLNPAGRMARPNPRANPVDPLDTVRFEKKLPKPLQKMSKIVRFPLESGFKLGRMIRSRREKARRHSSSATSGSGSVTSGEWGERVRESTPENNSSNSNRRSRQHGNPDATVRPTSTTASSGAREIVIIGDSEGEGGDSRSRSDSSAADGSSIAEIPELQESVARKFRDRLAIKDKCEKPKEKEKSKKEKQKGRVITDKAVAASGKVCSSAGEPIECFELEDGID